MSHNERSLIGVSHFEQSGRSLKKQLRSNCQKTGQPTAGTRTKLQSAKIAFRKSILLSVGITKKVLSAVLAVITPAFLVNGDLPR